MTVLSAKGSPTFDIDLEQCPQCGSGFRIIAAIEEPAVTGRILTHPERG